MMSDLSRVGRGHCLLDLLRIVVWDIAEIIGPEMAHSDAVVRINRGWRHLYRYWEYGVLIY